MKCASFGKQRKPSAAARQLDDKAAVGGAAVAGDEPGAPGAPAGGSGSGGAAAQAGPAVPATLGARNVDGKSNVDDKTRGSISRALARAAACRAEAALPATPADKRAKLLDTAAYCTRVADKITGALKRPDTHVRACAARRGTHTHAHTRTTRRTRQFANSLQGPATDAFRACPCPCQAIERNNVPATVAGAVPGISPGHVFGCRGASNALACAHTPCGLLTRTLRAQARRASWACTRR
jgi:hypothetical protein